LLTDGGEFSCAGEHEYRKINEVHYEFLFPYPGIKENQKDLQLLDTVEKLELYVSLTLFQLKKFKVLWNYVIEVFLGVSKNARNLSSPRC
jgi:hypothetical protein